MLADRLHVVEPSRARDEDDAAVRDDIAWPGKETLAELEASSGESLDADLRRELEAALGHELGDVRVHRDAVAARAARRLHARAFTIGRDVYFGDGRYEPASHGGRALIAHEVAHAVQQRGAASGGAPAISTPGDTHEQEAEAFASTFAAGGAPRPVGAGTVRAGVVSRAIVQRDVDPELEAEDRRRKWTAMLAWAEKRQVARAELDALVRASRELPDDRDRLEAYLEERFALDATEVQMQGSGSGGFTLPEDLRRRLERALRADLSGVRLHADAAAEREASELAANAYTIGFDIHFGAGKYDPQSTRGVQLIAHEVAHTVQHARAGAPSSAGDVSRPSDAHEVEARQFGEAFAVGGSAPVVEAAPAAIHRDGGPGAPPARYSTLDGTVRDLLWNSRDTFPPIQGATTGDEFWQKLDNISGADLQSIVQVLKKATAAGFGGIIQKLRRIYNFGSSWGIDFEGGAPPVGYPGWGKDFPQSKVREEHPDVPSSFDWYRQNTGAGNPGLHCGIGAFRNIHIDPTNPMKSVSDGILPAYWTPIPLPPFIAPVILPKGTAIYDAAALIQHAQDIGVLPGGDPNVSQTWSSQPWLDITILAGDFADKVTLYATMETNALGDAVDKGRATAAIGGLQSAAAAAKKLNDDARPLAMQDNDSHQAAVVALTGRLAAAKTQMFTALASFFAHLHEESGFTVGGNDSVGAWTMNTGHLHGTYEIVANAQKLRADKKKLKEQIKQDGGDDGGHVNDPLDGGAPGGMDPTPVQRKAIDRPALGDRAPGDVAAAAVRRSGGTLPHLEMIQTSFGHHDLGDVSAHVGGDAAAASAALGASAFAFGEAVAFASAPDLHTAAHEAAHVVQQRAGVALDHGLDGGASDPYERHADAVANAVVRGESAAALLDASPFARATIARFATGAIAEPSERALDLAASSSGRPLSAAFVQRFGYEFDHDFEHVVLHADDAAQRACRALAAHAVTIGAHVYLGTSGELDAPATLEVLQHELAHVVQYDRGELASEPARVTEPGDAVERGAHELVEATHARSSGHAPAAAASPSPAVIARSATGELQDTNLALEVTNGALVANVMITLTGPQAQRFQADSTLANRFAADFERVLVPGQPRFESRAFLESAAITGRLTRDVAGWLAGNGLAQTNAFLDQRAQTLANLHLLEPLERALAAQGIGAGTIDWSAVGPTLLAEQPAQPANTLIDASVQDRYYLFCRAIMTEAAARPAVVGATATATQLSPILHAYVDNLPISAFGDGVSVFSEAFLSTWGLQIAALRYTPDGFDVARFEPTAAAADLEATRTRVLDDFKRTKMPNLIVATVRDQWSASRMTPEGFLQHIDMESLRATVVARMVDEFMQLAASNTDYRAALRNAAHDQARYDAIRTLFTLATAMQASNQNLLQRLAATPVTELDRSDYEIAEDPQTFFTTASGVSQASLTLFNTLQSGGDLAAAMAALPDVEATGAVTTVAALVSLIAQINAIRNLRSQQDTATRDDLRRDIDLRYADVVHIVQTMWDDAEHYIHDVYIPTLKQVALQILQANRDEIAHWHDNWSTETPRRIATYRIAAFALDDVASRLRSGQAQSVQLQDQTLTIDDVGQLDNAAKALRALASNLESPEGASAQQRQLNDALAAFDRTRTRIEDGTYPAYSWGPAVTQAARQQLGIGEFPEFTTYGQVLTGAVQANQNPFLARAIAGWRFTEILDAEFNQAAILVGLGLLTVSSILVPGVGGLILTAVDLAVNIGVAAHGVVDARRALDLALLDPHLQLQGMSVDQARSALTHAWISLGLSILIPLGIAAFMGAMIWRAGRTARQLANLTHLDAAMQADPVRVERLLRAVPDAAHLDRLLGMVTGQAAHLETMLFHAGNDAVVVERLIARVPDAPRLASLLERAGTAEHLTTILNHTADVAQVDTLAARYGDNFILMETHLTAAGADSAAGARLLGFVEAAGGPSGMTRLLNDLGTTAEQAAFLRATEANPAAGVALAHAMAPAPGLSARMVRQLGNRMTTQLAADGAAVRISNQLTIAPQRLMALNEADMAALLRVCEDPAAHAAELRRFEGGTFRFRFRSSVAAQVDPWVATMLRDAGFAEGSAEFELFSTMSDADRQVMWDLPQNRGVDALIRPQAARWALGRQHLSVRQFVADYQFYYGEVYQQQDAILANIRAQAATARSAAEAAAGGRPLNAREILTINRRITSAPPIPGGGGGLGAPIDHLTGSAIETAARQRALREMAAPGAGGGTHGAELADAAAARSQASLTGSYATGSTQLAGAINPSTLAEAVRAEAGTLRFADPAEAAYHAHVHTREIAPADLVPGGNEVETYLNTARENVRSGTPSAPAMRADGGYSIAYARGRGRTIVSVSPDGVATIATYMPGGGR